MDVAITGDIEWMSMTRVGGNSISFSGKIFTKDENVAIASNMKITTENVVKDWNITRQIHDKFWLKNYQKATCAVENSDLNDETVLIKVRFF